MKSLIEVLPDLGLEIIAIRDEGLDEAFARDCLETLDVHRDHKLSHALLVDYRRADKSVLTVDLFDRLALLMKQRFEQGLIREARSAYLIDDTDGPSVSALARLYFDQLTNESPALAGRYAVFDRLEQALAFLGIEDEAACARVRDLTALF